MVANTGPSKGHRWTAKPAASCGSSIPPPMAAISSSLIPNSAIMDCVKTAPFFSIVHAWDSRTNMGWLQPTLDPAKAVPQHKFLSRASHGIDTGQQGNAADATFSLACLPYRPIQADGMHASKLPLIHNFRWRKFTFNPLSAKVCDLGRTLVPSAAVSELRNADKLCDLDVLLWLPTSDGNTSYGLLKTPITLSNAVH